MSGLRKDLIRSQAVAAPHCGACQHAESITSAEQSGFEARSKCQAAMRLQARAQGVCNAEMLSHTQNGRVISAWRLEFKANSPIPNDKMQLRSGSPRGAASATVAISTRKACHVALCVVRMLREARGLHGAAAWALQRSRLLAHRVIDRPCRGNHACQLRNS